MRFVTLYIIVSQTEYMGVVFEREILYLGVVFECESLYLGVVFVNLRQSRERSPSTACEVRGGPSTACEVRGGHTR